MLLCFLQPVKRVTGRVPPRLGYGRTVDPWTVMVLVEVGQLEPKPRPPPQPLVLLAYGLVSAPSRVLDLKDQLRDFL